VTTGAVTGLRTGVTVETSGAVTPVTTVPTGLLATYVDRTHQRVVVDQGTEQTGAR